MKKITLLFIGLIALNLNAQVLFSESFDDVDTLPGWSIINVSTTIGTTDWFQGTVTTFPSFAGQPFAYVAASFNATTGTNTINNWLITPVITLNNDDEITFYTRTSNGNFPDRLEVRISDLGAASVDPVNDSDVGSYNDLLLSVNPSLLINGYPDTWTQQTITVSGLTGATDVRLAFRYWVTDGGPTGSNSSYIGIDELEITTSTLSTNEMNQSDIKHFLNQTTKILKLESPQMPMNGIVVYDILGQETMRLPLNSTLSEVDLSALKTGVYIAKINADGASKSIKLLIK